MVNTQYHLACKLGFQDSNPNGLASSVYAFNYLPCYAVLKFKNLNILKSIVWHQLHEKLKLFIAQVPSGSTNYKVVIHMIR